MNIALKIISILLLSAPIVTFLRSMSDLFGSFAQSGTNDLESKIATVSLIRLTGLGLGLLGVITSYVAIRRATAYWFLDAGAILSVTICVCGIPYGPILGVSSFIMFMYYKRKLRKSTK